MTKPAIRKASYVAVLASTLFSVILSSRAFADSWGPPKREHWSAEERFVLKVAWGDGGKGLALWEKTGAGLKKHWERGYVDRYWPPYLAYVTDDGKYVVLRDVYHNLGYGEVIVILGEGGKVLGSYKLCDFLPVDEIGAARRSVSSLWWNENAWFSLIDDDRRFALVTQGGTVRCFDLPTGKMLDLSDEKRAGIVRLVRADAEKWVQSEKAGDRIRGITLLGGLRLKESETIAKRLFQDKTPTGSVSKGDLPSVEDYGVQTAAALALVRLIGREAIPVIEQELLGANWYMKEELTKVLERARQSR